MTSPSAFMKVKTEATEKKDAEGKQHRGGEGEEGKGHKKQKSKDGKGTGVKNPMQPAELNLTAGKNWKEQFLGIPIQDQPAWIEKVQMCARFHIKGDCFDNCTRKERHVTNDNILDDKRAAMKEFFAKCHAEIAKEKSA